MDKFVVIVLLVHFTTITVLHHNRDSFLTSNDDRVCRRWRWRKCSSRTDTLFWSRCHFLCKLDGTTTHVFNIFNIPNHDISYDNGRREGIKPDVMVIVVLLSWSSRILLIIISETKSFIASQTLFRLILTMPFGNVDGQMMYNTNPFQCVLQLWLIDILFRTRWSFVSMMSR